MRLYKFVLLKSNASFKTTGVDTLNFFDPWIKGVNWVIVRHGWTKYFDIKIPRDPSFMRVTGRWAGQDRGYQPPLTHFTFHKLIKAIWIIILLGIDSQIPQAYIT